MSKSGPPPGLIEEIGLWVPPLVTGDEHERRRRHRLADGALVDELAAGLQSAAEERVRRGAEAQASRPSRLDQPLPVLERDGEGLLVVDPLAGIQRRLGDRGVGIRCGEIENDLDRRVGQQLGDGANGRHAVLRGPLRRPLRHRIGAGDDLELGKESRVLQIAVADIAAADQPNSHWPSCRACRLLQPSQLRAAQCIPRRTISRASGTSKSAATWPSEQ